MSWTTNSDLEQQIAELNQSELEQQPDLEQQTICIDYNAGTSQTFLVYEILTFRVIVLAKFNGAQLIFVDLSFDFQIVIFKLQI